MTAVISRPAGHLQVRGAWSSLHFPVSFGTRRTAGRPRGRPRGRPACCCPKTNARMLISHVVPGRGRGAARDAADVQTAPGILRGRRIFYRICSISIPKRLLSNGLSAAARPPPPPPQREAAPPSSANRCERAIKRALLRKCFCQSRCAVRSLSTRGFGSAAPMPRR